MYWNCVENFIWYENNFTRDVILHNDFLKIFIDLKSGQNITHKFQGLDANHMQV